jgi:uncharacterized protein
VTERYVLDSWALMAYFKGEKPAAARVRELLILATQETAVISLSIINLGEVYYNLGKRAGVARAEHALERIRRLPLTIASVSEEAVMAAARLKMKYSVAYADAFAAELTYELGAILVTGDPELKQLQGYIALEILHRE